MSTPDRITSFSVYRVKCISCNTMVASIHPYPAHMLMAIECDRHRSPDWSPYIDRLDHTEELARAIAC